MESFEQKSYVNSKPKTDDFQNNNQDSNSNNEEIRWSIEEEYFFFEVHFLIGNKWTFLSRFFPNKSSKQIKNHFYSSIVKTLRKIIKKKIDIEIKDMIVTYYSLIYLKQLFSNPQYLYMIKNNINDGNLGKKNVTLKKLIITNNIDLNLIQNYLDKYEISIKNNISKQLKLNIDLSSIKVDAIFNSYIKMNLVLKSCDILKYENLSLSDRNVLEQFIESIFNNKKDKDI